jgi:ferric-dicitrate binding protein FerR (iron transport regulator)
MDYVDYKLEDFLADPSFQSYALGQSDEHVNFWRTWIALHPEKERETDQAADLLRLLTASRKTVSPSIKAGEWQKMRSRLERTPRRTFWIRPMVSRFNGLRVAAVLVGLLLLGTGYLATQRYYAVRRYSTGYGETKSVTLPDGSVVVLNAHSRLRYPEDLAEQVNREVWLEGEAFFSVRKRSAVSPNPSRQAARKFTVHTQDLDVQVLGTEFTVSRRQSNTRVTLNSGKVKLAIGSAQHGEAIYLQPGDQVEYHGEGKKLVRKQVRPEVYSAWTRQIWLLDRTSLAEVASRIEETFGVTVRIESPQARREIMTGVVPTRNLNSLLEGIATIYQLEVERRGSVIVLRK